MLALLAALLAATPTQTPSSEPAAATASALQLYVVSGFRSARFGMTETEVRAAAAADLGVAPASLERATNRAEGTTTLTARLPEFSPGLGAAAVTYILGAASQTLMHVNIVWLVAGEASVEDRANQTAAGLALAEYFQSFAWAPDGSAAGIPLGESSAIMFIGRSIGGGAVEVRADGVSFRRVGAATQPVVSGPVALTVSYGLSAADPDIAQIRRGEF